ncbi:MAG: hypothetical protein KY455_13505 [Euryarchaeota archaeon]|nr:hypothetical protein [Euryarchaeota archaeon]
MTRVRHLVVGIVGAVAIVLTLVGLFAIETRPGPIERPLVPAGHEVLTEGTYATRAASGDIGPGGVCVPEPPATTCTQAETQVRLRLSGLPDPGAGRYHAFLLGASAMRPLGPLDADKDGFVLRSTAARDGQDADRLLVSLESRTDTRRPGPLIVYEQDLDDDTDLSRRYTMHLIETVGEVRLNQIGAVEVSATAKATVPLPTPLDGWHLHAWFVDAAGRAVDLGPFEHGDDRAVLDARVERVDLAVQTRFLVTLEPLDAAPEVPSDRLVSDVPL